MSEAEGAAYIISITLVFKSRGRNLYMQTVLKPKPHLMQEYKQSFLCNPLHAFSETLKNFIPACSKLLGRKEEGPKQRKKE